METWEHKLGASSNKNIRRESKKSQGKVRTAPLEGFARCHVGKTRGKLKYSLRELGRRRECALETKRGAEKVKACDETKESMTTISLSGGRSASGNSLGETGRPKKKGTARGSGRLNAGWGKRCFKRWGGEEHLEKSERAKYEGTLTKII